MPQVSGATALVLGLSQTLYLTVTMTLGVRLILLARRTRRLPEALLGAHFVLCLSLGYALLGAGHVAGLQPGQLPRAVMVVVIGVGQLASCSGVFAGIAFNYWVFRRGELWAQGLVALAAATLAASYVGYGLSGGFAHGRVGGLCFWLGYGSYVAAGLWVLIEPLRYHAVLRRRLPLGLVEPMVVDRFLLYGVGSAFRFAMLVIGAWAMHLAESAAAQVEGMVAPVFLIVAAAGLGVAAAYSLAFFPPAVYARFVERRYRPARG
jgi:hypothetical protein